MSEKITVVALGHRALGTTLPEQKIAAKKAAKAIADLVEAGNRVVISHSNGPQVGMIHTAMNEFGKAHPDYTFAPMSVCSAMSQGYIGYDLQTAIRAELISRGIYKPVATILTQVVIDPYDDAFAEPEKIIGRVLTEEEAEAEENKGNFVTKLEDGTYKRIVAAPKPQKIIELETIRTLVDAGQIVIAAGGGGIPVMEQGIDLHGASAIIEKDLSSGLLAQELNAEYQIVAWNGKGVISAYIGEERDEPDPQWRLPFLYDYTDGGSEKDYYKKEEKDWEKWDHQSYQADIVTVYLGTNDASYTREIPQRDQEFIDAYKLFLGRIHQTQPQAAILCMLGTMDQRLCPATKRAVEEYAKNHKEVQIEYLELPAQSEEDGLGTFWHPTAITHRKVADKVVAKIKEMMRW